jgi:dTMP kinase
MTGRFISFEGNEGSGKSTQIKLLAERIAALGRTVVQLREPGGTRIGEEIRHLLKHSDANAGMTPETELLLMNASRAQLVREIIRPALASHAVILCDRFHDSTVVYQGYGRGLDLHRVREVLDLAIGETVPHLTLMLEVPIEVSEQRRTARGKGQPVRDRFEEADRAFFQRIHEGYQRVAEAEPQRIRRLDATRSVEEVAAAIWTAVEPLLAHGNAT